MVWPGDGTIAETCCWEIECDATGVAAVPVTKIEFELTDVVVFGDGCGKEAGAGLIDVVDGCGRGDTTDPSPKAFRPRKLCKKKIKYMWVKITDLYVS